MLKLSAFLLFLEIKYRGVQGRSHSLPLSLHPSLQFRSTLQITFTLLVVFEFTVGTKIIADPEKCFLELISEILLILLRDRPGLGLIIVSSNFQVLLILRDKLLESV